MVNEHTAYQVMLLILTFITTDFSQSTPTRTYSSLNHTGRNCRDPALTCYSCCCLPCFCTQEIL